MEGTSPRTPETESRPPPAPADAGALAGAPTDDAYAVRFSLRGRTLRGHAARGTLVNAAFLSVLNLLALVKGFLVAAFLTTSDYGIWGIVAVMLATVLWLRETGAGDKYVQQDEEDQEIAFQKAFTVELVFAAALGALLVALIPVAALVYDRTELIAPGLAIALMLPAASLSAPLWIFYRRMQFVTQRALQAIDPVLSFVVTIGLAVAGAGYWSLVIGALVGAWGAAIGALIASPYRLAIRFDRAALREYAGFSWPLLVAALGAVVMAQGAMIAGEHELGLGGAGAIALASTVVSYTDRVDEVITATLYPAICAARERTEVLFESFVKSNRLALMWGVPFGVAVALFASDVVEFGIGEEWQPAVGLLQAFGLIAAANHIGFNWEAYYRARGETRPLAVVTAVVALAFVVIAIPLLVTDGLDGFALGMAIVTAISLLLRLAYVRRLFGGFRMGVQAARAIAPTVPAAAAVLGLRALGDFERSAALAVGELVLFAALTAAATAFFERALLREVVGYLRAPAPATAA